MEEIMAFVRIGKFTAKRDLIDEICRTYEREAIPNIRAAKGNISAVLLQQTDSPDSFLAITVWHNQADADAYDKSGLAIEMVNKIRHGFSGPPTLLTYRAFGVSEFS